jgi:NTP pyrophosphatase (non-canonical NTP hydrolase)
VTTESQETVFRWTLDTFPGMDPESPRKSLRLLEEAFELCLASGASFQEMHSALAKVWHSCGCPGMEARPLSSGGIPAEAADVLIVLYSLAGMRGFDLHAEVERKMAINRARKWAPRGDGTGYHVKEGA